VPKGTDRESDITTEIRYNLRPELKHELLHVPTPSLSVLRKECHRHEEFFRSSRSRPNSLPISKNSANAIQVEEEIVDSEENESLHLRRRCV